MTPVVRALLIVNVAAFGLQHITADSLYTHFALWPVGRHPVPPLGWVGFEPWQLITSAFLHSTDMIAHIALNMFVLYSFGGMVEKTVGSRRFAALYFASVLTAAMVQLMVVSAASDGGAVPTVGASGGVFGVLLAFAFLYPHARVMLIFPPIPMKAWVLVSLYAAVELASGVFGTTKGIAHFAHLGGMLGAGAALLYWRASRPRVPQP